MEIWKIVLMIVGVVAILIAAILIVKSFVREGKKVRHFNVRRRGFTEMPAVPFILTETIVATIKLGLRTQENKMAKEGLNEMYTIDGQTRSAYTFMYETSEVDAGREEREALVHRLSNTHESVFLSQGVLTKNFEQAAHEKVAVSRTFNELFLKKPEQFSMSWTNWGALRSNAESKLNDYASILIKPDEASEQFWPMIANHGLAYNLLFLQKVGEAQIEDLKTIFTNVWSEVEAFYESKNLYCIDLRIFSKWDSSKVKNFDRWTPGTLILLKQDPITKKLTPIAVYVSATNKLNAQIFTRKTATDSAWIFALMAARTSVTVYGIWLGHVYHWHIVSAAMQMTLFNEVPDPSHPLRKLLDPQSKSLIGFDAALLLLWKTIGPPTSFSSPDLFLALTNEFAKGRNFFDDDPKVALANLGLEESDFTVSEPWDQYPIVADLLKFWDISERFATKFVDETYTDDTAVFNDTPLQEWMKQSSNPLQGNVRGLPRMDSKKNLKKVLSSLINRVVAHGNSRQLNSLSPELCFVANYPPCLQDARVPAPTETISQERLLNYLPNTGTIGEMMTFYFIFTYSVPYNPLIPLFGMNQDLYFDPPSDPRNAALIEFRESIKAFIENYDTKAPMIHQWPASIET